jgi:amino-acid N-acetyltransferase
MDQSVDHVELIREVFRYAQAFHEKTFVLQIDDAVVLRPTLSGLMRDLVMMHQTGIRVVLVAGARTLIDEVLDRYGIACERHRGVRISSPEAIPFIRMAAFDSANRLMTSLTGHGVNAVIGNWVRARSLGVVDGIDFQDAGTVDRIQGDLLRGILERGSVPILPCIGWSRAGRPYNVSSRELATELAVALGASKLFFVADAEPLNARDYTVSSGTDTAPDGRLSRFRVDQARDFLEANAGATGAGIELVERGVEAAGAGVDRVHIVDGRVEGVILQEIFSNLGAGTMIHANQYQAIRQMRRSDVPDVYRLMEPLVERGLLVQRQESDLHDYLHDFVVFETDGMVHGCCGLHRFEDGSGEIAGLAIDSSYEQFGIGERLVRFLIDRARTEGISQLFVLTVQASDWFEKLGFEAATVDQMPPEKRARYDRSRNSRVLTYTVGPLERQP